MCSFLSCVSQVYWFKDGKQISKRSEHYRISRDPDGTCSLHTAAASLDDDGNYTIMAGNPEVSGDGCTGNNNMKRFREPFPKKQCIQMPAWLLVTDVSPH